MREDPELDNKLELLQNWKFNKPDTIFIVQFGRKALLGPANPPAGCHGGGVKCQGSGGYGSRDYLGDHELTSLIMKDDVIFSLPLLSMTLIMSEEYHQELSTSTLHSPSMRPRDSSQSELLDFISWNLSPDLWTFSKKYCVSLQSLSIQNSLRWGQLFVWARWSGDNSWYVS